MRLFGLSPLQTRHLQRRIFLHIRRRPKLFLLAAFLSLVVTYILYEIFAVSPLSGHDHHEESFNKFSAGRCATMNEPTRVAFELFVRRVLSILDMLKVTHFLCYGSLWTVLQKQNKVKSTSTNKSTTATSSLRMSDACFNLCILNEDLMKHDEALIEMRFHNNGIELKYIHSDGLYVLKPSTRIFSNMVSPTDDPGLHPDLFSIHARVHVFEKDSVQNMYRRVGWKNRLKPSFMCTQLHCFPPNLVDRQPLPQLELLPSLMVNVPQEGIEIQKYQYPDTWWTMANSIDDDCSEHEP